MIIRDGTGKKTWARPIYRSDSIEMFKRTWCVRLDSAVLGYVMQTKKVPYKDISPDVLVEASLGRASSFVNTNGMIQVTLCGLFATTVAILVALAEESANSGSKDVIYGYVIPAFSIVLFTISMNVYGWIEDQLRYLSEFGRLHVATDEFLTYEQAFERRNQEWDKLNWLKRAWVLVSRSLAFQLSIPFRISNIYCYYFLLFAVTPYLSLWYMPPTDEFLHAALAVFILQFLAVIMGRKDLIKADITGESFFQSLKPKRRPRKTAKGDQEQEQSKT